MLPEDVLHECADEMLSYKGSGMGVMEMSHRSSLFEGMLEEAKKDLADLLGVPANYRILFLQGGGHTQFAMVPMNLMRSRSADYIISGHWAKKAAEEAALYGRVNITASSEAENFTCIPDLSQLEVSADADYVYICQNNTIYGTRIKTLPDTKGKPLVSDVSSMFLSGPMDVFKYGILWGGAQKNIGPAGVTIVIIREDLIREDVLPGTPRMLRYKIHADGNSMYNTPPCWNIYVCGLVFKWLKSIGGLEEMERRNIEKAEILYDFLDGSKMFRGTVRKEDRSLMNLCFVTDDAGLDAKFIAEADSAGLKNLKGHRSVGGMRASLYNAMPRAGVLALVNFMEKFEKENR